MIRLAVIVASTREGRFGETVARWFVEQARQRPDLEIDVIDLLHTPLPARLQASPTPELRAFAERIGAADAYVVVTPEYNHGYPASLKHAIDSVYAEWQAKPVGFVAYGGISGGLRAVEQLRLVFAELHAVGVRDTVSFDMAQRQFDEDGQPRDPDTVNRAAAVLLDQLVWWALALREARAARPYGT